MAQKITAATMFDTLEIDLWGNEYTLRSITRSVAIKVTEAQAEVEAFEDADQTDADAVDAGAKAVIGLLDLLLEPKGDTEPAGTVLGELWEQDKVGIDWLVAFMAGIQAEANQRRRPTSPTRTRR